MIPGPMIRQQPGMSAEEEQWKKVSKNDKKRVMRKRRTRVATSNAKGVVGTLGEVIEDCHHLSGIVKMCIQEVKMSYFYANFIEHVNMEKIKQVVCYGIGNFSRTSASHFSAPLWQLAFALALRDYIKDRLMRDVTMYYFDPCSTHFELEFLTECSQVVTITSNEKGRRHIDSKPTLFFMPHCPVSLYENVLYTNWEDLSNLFIVGNSLKLQLERLDRPKLPCIELLEPFLNEIPIVITKDSGTSGNLLGAFNDTFVMTVNDQVNVHCPDRPDGHSTIFDKELL